MRNGRFLFGLAVPVLLGGGKTVDPCQPGWRSWELGSCDPDLRIFCRVAGEPDLLLPMKERDGER